MRYSLFIALFVVLFTACKPTSAVITSKETAVKKGIYSAPPTYLASSDAEFEPTFTKPEVKNDSRKKETTARNSGNKKIGDPAPKKALVLNDKNDNDIVISNEETSYLIEQILYNISENLGIAYRGGGTTKAGFDCSGLIYSTFKKYDIELPRSSREMAQVGEKIDLKEAKKGDLIFFINRGQNRINHVGLVVETNGEEVKFIHSASRGGVMVSSTKEPYYQKTFVQVNRVTL